MSVFPTPSTSDTLLQTTRIELSLHFDLNHTPTKFCDCTRYCGDNLSTDRRTDSQTDINTCQSTQNHLSGSFHHRTSLECPGFVSELYLLHVITISSFTVHHRNNQIILRPIKDNSCSRCYMLGASVWWFVISSAGEEIAS